MAETAAAVQLKRNQNTMKTFMARMNKISRSYEKRQRAASVTMEKNADRLADSHDKLVKAIDRNTEALLRRRDYPKIPEPEREPDVRMKQQAKSVQRVNMRPEIHLEPKIQVNVVCLCSPGKGGNTYSLSGSPSLGLPSLELPSVTLPSVTVPAVNLNLGDTAPALSAEPEAKVNAAKGSVGVMKFPDVGKLVSLADFKAKKDEKKKNTEEQAEKPGKKAAEAEIAIHVAEAAVIVQQEIMESAKRQEVNIPIVQSERLLPEPAIHPQLSAPAPAEAFQSTALSVIPENSLAASADPLSQIQREAKMALETVEILFGIMSGNVEFTPASGIEGFSQFTEEAQKATAIMEILSDMMAAGIEFTPVSTGAEDFARLSLGAQNAMGAMELLLGLMNGDVEFVPDCESALDGFSQLGEGASKAMGIVSLLKNAMSGDLAIRPQCHTEDLAKGMQESQAAMDHLGQSVEAAAEKTDALGAAMKNAADVDPSSTEALGKNIGQAAEKQKDLNKETEKGATGFQKLVEKTKDLVKSYMNLDNLKKGFQWVMDATKLSDAQQMTELKLQTVMQHSGGTEAQFDAIKEKALELQDKTVYGDQVMLAGAAELFKRTEDAGATETLMGTLANFAAGASAGGNVDMNGMASYAADLAKALEGDYSALETQGIKLTDKQKEMIEQADMMNKALVLDEIISASWGELAENMANTPTGVLDQMSNTITNLKESLGAQLAPALTQFLTAVQSGMPFVALLFEKLGTVLWVVFSVLSVIATVVSMIGNFFAENWGWIEPIVWGLVAAFVAYNVILHANWLLTLQTAAASALKAVQQGIETAATFLATIAQQGLNAALLACPIVWIIIGIALIVMAIAMWVQKIGGLQIAWLTVVNAVLTAAGKLKIGVMTCVFGVIGFIENLQLKFAQAKVAIANHVGDLRVSVLKGLQDMVNGGIDIINSFIDALNNLPLVNLEAVQHVTFGTLAELENEAEKAAREDDLAAYESDLKAAAAERDNLLETWTAEENAKEQERKAEIADLKGKNAGGEDDNDAWYKQIENTAGDMQTSAGETAANTGNTAYNTAEANNTMEKSTEDLKYMRLLAEREAINRYTTSEITINQTNNNSINSDLDVDGILSAFTEDFAEKLEISAEGVYA